jgi:hypothetical protein
LSKFILVKSVLSALSFAPWKTKAVIHRARGMHVISSLTRVTSHWRSAQQVLVLLWLFISI